MRLRSLFAMVCLAPLGPLACAAASAQVGGETSLAKLRDRARPLLIFAPRPDDTLMLKQLRLLNKHAAEMKERDVVVLALPGTGTATTPAKLTPAEGEIARRRFRVGAADFVVILIGKDGGEKLRSRHPLRVESLTKEIDAMPMRQDEMRSRPR